MQRVFPNRTDSILFAGHALMWAMVGVAILLDRVVGVPRTPANVAVGIGAIVTAVLLVMGEFEWLPPRWRRLGWMAFVADAGAFLVINFF